MTSALTSGDQRTRVTPKATMVISSCPIPRTMLLSWVGAKRLAS
ncbi:hypothetical protein [Micromonospora sp. NBC_00617]